MVTVAVRHNDEVQRGQVNVVARGVVGNNVRVTACIEKDAFAVILK